MASNLEKFAAALSVNKNGCKDCQNEVLKEVKESLAEGREGAYSRLAEIAYALKIQAGITQRLLTKFEEADGTPKGDPYVFSKSSPAQNTNYTGNPSPYDGVIRSMIVSGPGNVTVTLNTEQSINNTVTLAIVDCNGGAVTVPLHFRMPLSATLSISTDSSSGSGLLALTAWVEPIMESNPEYFRMRR